MKFENGSYIEVTKLKGEDKYYTYVEYVGIFSKGEIGINDYDKTEKQVTANMKGLQTFKRVYG